jgi:hypothetical protein
MQQPVLKRAYDICNPSDALFDVIILTGTVRFEVLTPVTKGCCLRNYRYDILEDSSLQERQ